MELTVVEKHKALKELSKIFFLFIIGSILGFIIELILTLIQNWHFVLSQGLIYVPFILLYDVGLLIFYLIMPHAKTNLQTFIAGFVLGGSIEYLFSYFQERYFGIVSWDYSNLLFNLNGRTSILHCIYWGIGGILFMKFIYPYLSNLDKIYKRNYFKVLTVFLVIFMTFIISFHKI